MGEGDTQSRRAKVNKRVLSVKTGTRRRYTQGSAHRVSSGPELRRNQSCEHDVDVPKSLRENVPINRPTFLLSRRDAALPPSSLVSPRIWTEICRSHRKEEPPVNKKWQKKKKQKAKKKYWGGGSQATWDGGTEEGRGRGTQPVREWGGWLNDSTSPFQLQQLPIYIVMQIHGPDGAFPASWVHRNMIIYLQHFWSL